MFIHSFIHSFIHLSIHSLSLFYTEREITLPVVWHQAQGQIKQSRHLLDQILGLMGGRCRQCSPRLLSVWAKPVELLQDCLVWDCVPRLCVRWEATLPALSETWWLLVSFPEWPELQSQKEGVFWSTCYMYNYMSDRSSQNLIHV